MRKGLLSIPITLALMFTAIDSSCQSIIKNNKYTASSSLFLSSTDKLPFWIQANQYGEIPYESQFLQLKASVKHEYDSLYTQNKALNKFSYGYGLTGVINTGKVNQAIISEGYFKVRHGIFEIYAGRRKEIVGLVDSSLTSGSYIWSGNALPIPKLQLAIPNYSPITKRQIIAFKAGYSHGWFDKNRPTTKKVKLHQKWLYARIGSPCWKTKIHFGFNHQVQWGGESPFYSINGNLPDGLKNYFNMLIGKRSSNKDIIKDVPFENNRIGNHLGTIDVALEYLFKKGKLLIYRQNIYEDGSLFYLNNIKDGLNGLSLKFNRSSLITNINIEYLSTLSQGGSYFLLGKNAPDEFRGADDYFNNSQYKDGWTYKGLTIGTPYILALNQNWNSSSYFLDNNRVQLIYYAINGVLPRQISYTIKVAHSLNRGTYSRPLFKTSQNSYLLHISKKLQQNSHLDFNCSIDSGTLLPQNLGANLTWIKQWK